MARANQPDKENGGKVLFLSKPKRFTLAQARELLPRVKEVTERAVEKATPYIDQLQEEALPLAEQDDLMQLLQKIVDEWSEEIAKLGAMTKGLWLVDFDSGNGYFCWVYGEETIDYFHGYEDGFAGRTPIQ